MAGKLLAGTGRELLTKTIGETHFYANSSTGSDSNNGLTALTAKATLEGVRQILPDKSSAKIIVHLEGDFEIAANAMETDAWGPEYRFDVNCPVLFVDGGTDLTVVEDDGGSPWTSDISSTFSIGTTGNGWTINEHRGFWIEVVDGVAAGQTRQIFSNTADTLVPTISWPVDPGACSYRIVRPATTLSTSTGIVGLSAYNKGGQTYIQHLYLDTDVCLIPAGDTTVTGLIIKYSSSYGIGGSQDANRRTERLFMWAYRFDTSTVTYPANTAAPLCSVSVIDWAGWPMYYNVTVYPPYCIELWGVIFAGLGGAGYTGPVIENVTRFRIAGCFVCDFDVHIRGIKNGNFGKSTVTAIAGSVTDGATWYLDDCSIDFFYDINVSNSPGDAIRLRNCFVRQVSNGIEGTGNVGAGMHLSNGSRVHLDPSKTTPTITGTVGEISLDGVVQAETWANVKAGSPVIDVTGFNLLNAEAVDIP